MLKLIDLYCFFSIFAVSQNVLNMETNDREKAKNGTSIGGVFFVGCMFIGAGIGMVYDAVPIGGAIGMGIGFIAMGIVWAYYTKRK